MTPSAHSGEGELAPGPLGLRRHAWGAVGVAAMVALLALVVSQTTGKESPNGDPAGSTASDGAGGVGVSGGTFMVIGRQELAGLPISGREWEAMVKVAVADLGAPDLADQDSTVAGRTVAAALVYARTGEQSYRDRVVTVLKAVEGAPLSNARVLSVGRQLAGFVIAADLVDYRADSFVAWAGSMRTKTLGGHSRWYGISQTSEDSANNWGSWALASRIAVSAFVGDDADLARAAQVFRGAMGERDAYASFAPTADFDPTWACDPNQWVPINPAGCGALSGAPVEDVSRSAGNAPSIDDSGLTYAWEFLGGATLSARVLAHSGYPGVYEWGDRALLRAGRFMAANGGYPARYSVNQYIPWEIDNAYNVTLGPLNAAGLGRQFGFTDWLSGPLAISGG